MVSARERVLFADNGFVAIRGVIAAPVLSRLHEALAEVEARLAEPGANVETLWRWNLSTSATTVTPVIKLLTRLHPAFREYAFGAAVTTRAAALIGADELRLITDTLIRKSPHVSGAVHWHHDDAYWDFTDDAQIACWLALTDVDADSGAMRYVPGSHRIAGEFAAINVGTGRRSAADRRAAIPADPGAAGHEVAVVELEAGSCVFHHSRTWHASAPNVGRHDRVGYVCHYLACGQQPIDEQEFPRVWSRAAAAES